MHRAHLRRAIGCSNYVFARFSLTSRKDSWNLAQTVDTNGLAFKFVNLHGFTTKDTRSRMCVWVREPINGNNNSLESWLL